MRLWLWLACAVMLAAGCSSAGPDGPASGTGITGLPALNVGHDASVTSVSCSSPGNCSAAGHDLTDGRAGLFVAREVRGRWGPARAVPGLAVLTSHRQAAITSVACTCRPSRSVSALASLRSGRRRRPR